MKLFCCLLVTFAASASSFSSSSRVLATPRAASRVVDKRNAALLRASPVDDVMDLAFSHTGFHSITSDTAGMVASSSMILSETDAWVQPLSLVLGPLLNFFSVAMLCRIVLSWYPTANVNELPFSLAVWPTEPFLRLVRNTIPPAFGVDISPVVWLGIFSFLNEILLGQQGLLVMKMKYGN